MTKRYRDLAIRNKAIGGFFGRDAIEKILAQNDCVGMRYYFAVSTDNVLKVVLVGTKADENDIVDGELAEFSTVCPSQCGANNALNSD